MDIAFRMAGQVVDNETGRPVAVPLMLDGWKSQEARLAVHLDVTLADRGVIGGTISADMRDGTPEIVVTYSAPSSLNDDELKELIEFTATQMQDGIGEGGFVIGEFANGVVLVPVVDAPLFVEQVEGEGIVPPASPIAIAARDGSLTSLRRAIAEDPTRIDAAHQGCPPLHLAMIYGRFECARLLIESGADANRLDHMGTAPLEVCALSNSLTDSASETLARLLLARGADPLRVDPTGHSAADFAKLRGKSMMAGLLAPRERWEGE